MNINRYKEMFRYTIKKKIYIYIYVYILGVFKE